MKSFIEGFERYDKQGKVVSYYKTPDLEQLEVHRIVRSHLLLEAFD